MSKSVCALRLACDISYTRGSYRLRRALEDSKKGAISIIADRTMGPALPTFKGAEQKARTRDER